MKSKINQILNVLIHHSTVEVDTYNKTVFLEAESEDVHILLETTDIYSEWDVQIHLGEERVTEAEFVGIVSDWLFKYAENDLNNVSVPFTHQDQIHANNQIFA